MTIAITKTFNFSCVKIIDEHEYADYENQYFIGHNYKMDVELKGAILHDNKGHVCNEQELILKIYDKIIDKISNAIIYNKRNPKSCLLIKQILKINPKQKIFDTTEKPTVEYLAELIREEINKVYRKNVFCSRLTLYEKHDYYAVSKEERSGDV